MTSARDDFYVGYLGMPPALGRWVRARVLACVALVLGAAALLTLAQAPPDEATYEFGVRTELTGWVLLEPVPQLLVQRPGDTRTAAPVSRLLLTVFGKRGARDAVAPFADRRVTLAGQLIYRGDRTMLEVDPTSIRVLEGAPPPPLDGPVDLGERTLLGEIVDSKCYFGVMKPGHAKPHRACAVRCISGGVPPVLMVRDERGAATYLLLVDEAGGAVNRRVLHLVAEPVSITGRVERLGDLLVLRADPRSYRRL
jgi:hypothetical protein